MAHKPPTVIQSLTYKLKGGHKHFQGEIGSDAHKIFIFQRALKACNWQEGETLLWKRNPVQVLAVIDEVHDPSVEWDGLSPKFIEVWLLGSQEPTFMVHPSSLKRVK